MIFRKRIKEVLVKFRLLNLIRKINNKRYFLYLKRIYPKIKKTGEIPLPNSFVYEPTNKCNLNCKMCFFNQDIKKDYSKELSLDEIKDIFNKINLKSIIFTGGEPFMKKDFFDILDFLKEKEVPIHITTNGTMINENNINKLLKNDLINHIGISIDGNEKMHDIMRRSNKAFSRAINGLELIKDKIPVSIVCVITEENFDQLEYVINLAKKLNVGIHFEYERRYTKKEINNAINLLNLNKKDIPLTINKNSKPNYSLITLKNKIEAFEKIGKEAKMKVHYFPNYLKSEIEDCYNRSMRKKGRYICRALFTGRIDSKGNVIHCFGIRKKFGNLKEKNFEEIWNSEEFKLFRKKLLQNNLLPMCETCLYMHKIK